MPGNEKPGRSRAFRVARCGASGGAGDRLDAGGEAALVAGGLVAVDQATGAEPVEQRLRGVERLLRAGGVIGVERLQHLLDGGAHLRALAVVAQVAHDGLLGALLGGLDVGHGGILGTGVKTNSGQTSRKVWPNRPFASTIPWVTGRVGMNGSAQGGGNE